MSVGEPVVGCNKTCARRIVGGGHPIILTDALLW